VGKRRRFSQEFKIEAVLMVDQGREVVDVAQELGIRPDMLRKWKKKFEEDGHEAFPGSGRQKPEDEEMRRLRWENRRLQMQLEILKKAVAIVSDRPL
jgi:transposase